MIRLTTLPPHFRNAPSGLPIAPALHDDIRERCEQHPVGAHPRRIVSSSRFGVTRSHSVAEVIGLRSLSH